METVMNCLLDVAEKLDRVGKARQVTEIPTNALNPPQITQWAWGTAGFKRHECLRQLPRGRFSETQWERGDKASGKRKTCCVNAARGVVRAKAWVGRGGVTSRDHIGGTQRGKEELKCGDCATGPKSPGRADNRRFEGTQPFGASMEPQPWSATMDDRS